MNLCQYSDIFGRPREGSHSYRVGDFAIVDVLLTLVAAIILAFLTDTSLLATAGGLLVLSIVFHLAFCVKTHLTHDILRLN
jgi:hypothetical protein